MIMYVTAKTKLQNVSIDYLEFETPKGDILVDFDFSSNNVESGTYYGKLKGITFNDEYANGMLEELNDAVLRHVQIHTPDTLSDTEACDSNIFQITSILVEDQEQRLKMEIRNTQDITFTEE